MGMGRDGPGRAVRCGNPVCECNGVPFTCTCHLVCVRWSALEKLKWQRRDWKRPQNGAVRLKVRGILLLYLTSCCVSAHKRMRELNAGHLAGVSREVDEMMAMLPIHIKSPQVSARQWSACTRSGRRGSGPERRS